MLASLTGRRPQIAIASAAALATVAGGSAAYGALSTTVTLAVDGTTTQVSGFGGTVDDVLDDHGITVSARDIVAPAPDTELDDGDTVVVRYARPVTLTVDGQKRIHWTTELSVDRALTAIGVRADGARLSASRSQRIERAGLAMWLSTPKAASVLADGKKRPVTTTAPTVAEMLREQRVVLGPMDEVSVPVTAPITDGIKVRVVRVQKKRITVNEKIGFAVDRVSSKAMYKGETDVVTSGKSGSRKAVYDVLLADGKITKKKLVSRTVTSKPRTQVVKVGTKKRPSVGGSVGGSADGLNWAALAKCESGGNPGIVSSNGLYHGLYQFSVATWRSVGGSGLPSNASSSEQTYRAKLLYKKAGAGQWPHCGPRLFS